MTLRISSLSQEGIYQGSKYLKYQVLASTEELARLFEQLGPFAIYLLTGLSDGSPIEQARFLTEYDSWIRSIKEGIVPTDLQLRRLVACAWTIDADALWKQETPNSKFIVKVAKPVVQVQAHFFTYSSVDGVFRPMTMGPESLFWGLQLAFPQIYQDPKTMEFFETDESPNAELFQKIKQWIREETRATPFLVEAKKINVPIRLGKSCFSWIHKHPQLIERQIGVYAS